MCFDCRHVALDQPWKQIRLLTLQSADDDLPIAGDLSVYAIDDGPEYIGVSYTCGDVMPRLLVQINDQMVRVKLNYWYALWQIRHRSLHATVWINSICINQSDTRRRMPRSLRWPSYTAGPRC